MKNIKTKLCSLFIVILIFGIYGCKENEQKQELDDVSIENKLLYSRAFEVALWALPVTESFSARIAVVRDLGGEPNDIVINTKPMDSDIHLIALQSQTPYLQGAIDLTDGPIVVDIPKATSISHLYGVIVDA